MMAEKIELYDTTLRDGTQGEGISFSVIDKIRIAEKLDAFGVDYIEGGWPGSNPKDIAFFQEAAKKTWKHAKVAAFGSTRRANTTAADDSQVRTLIEANTPTITIFGKSWRLQVSEVLKVPEAENQAMIRETVAYLKSAGREVIYDAEHFFDGYKDDDRHALATLEAASQGGADALVLCDTNGGTMPWQVAEIVTDVIARFPGLRIGIHTHNDCGLGVATALEAIRTGCCHVQGTMNGYGERTGNCNLISVIPNLELKMGKKVVPDLTRLRELSMFVDDLANCSHDIRAPFVGATAFAHKGGMHVNAVQKLARTYEHIEPGSVGNSQHILVSELSGQSNVLLKAKELGVVLQKNSPEVQSILKRVKELESEGYEFEAAEGSFELLVRKVLTGHKPFFELLEYHTTFRRSGVESCDKHRSCDTCEATVKVMVDGRREYTVSEGDGPVHALDKALRKALRPFYPCIDEISLLDYKVRILDSANATAARTRVLIVSTDRKRQWSTVGVSDNIIEASWEALVDSIELKLLYDQATPHVSNS